MALCCKNEHWPQVRGFRIHNKNIFITFLLKSSIHILYHAIEYNKYNQTPKRVQDSAVQKHQFSLLITFSSFHILYQQTLHSIRLNFKKIKVKNEWSGHQILLFWMSFPAAVSLRWWGFHHRAAACTSGGKQ